MSNIKMEDQFVEDIKKFVNDQLDSNENNLNELINTVSDKNDNIKEIMKTIVQIETIKREKLSAEFMQR